jgi:hypothetical protein
MARPRKIASAEELAVKLDEFIKLVDSGKIDKPTDYRLCEYLNISHDLIELWNTERDNYKGYSAALKKLEQYREQFWLNKADDPKLATFAIFNLKQKKNGGYTDKQEIEHKDLKIDVKINGISGNPFA